MMAQFQYQRTATQTNAFINILNIFRYNLYIRYILHYT